MRFALLLFATAGVLASPEPSPSPSNDPQGGAALLMPKRMMASISSKVPLHFSENEIENAFIMGQDQARLNSRLEDELVQQGWITNMSQVSATSRHQAVTTTLPLGNLYDHEQAIFEEASKVLLRK